MMGRKIGGRYPNLSRCRRISNSRCCLFAPRSQNESAITTPPRRAIRLMKSRVFGQNRKPSVHRGRRNNPIRRIPVRPCHPRTREPNVCIGGRDAQPLQIRTGVSPIRRGDAAFLTIHAAFSIRVPRTIPHTPPPAQLHVLRRSAFFPPAPTDARVPRSTSTGRAYQRQNSPFQRIPFLLRQGQLRGPPRQPGAGAGPTRSARSTSSVNGPLAMGRTSKTGRPRSVTWIGSPDWLYLPKHLQHPRLQF